VGNADQPQPIAAQPQSADDTAGLAFLPLARPLVDLLVGMGAFEGKLVFEPDALDAVQGAAPRAEEEVVEGTERLEGVVRHRNPFVWAGHGNAVTRNFPSCATQKWPSQFTCWASTASVNRTR